MSSILQNLEKDKPLFSLTIGEFQALVSELIPAPVLVKEAPALSSKFVDVFGAASILGRTPSAIRKLLSTGKLTALKQGNNRNYFEREYLEKWMRGETDSISNKKRP